MQSEMLDFNAVTYEEDFEAKTKKTAQQSLLKNLWQSKLLLKTYSAFLRGPPLNLS